MNKVFFFLICFVLVNLVQAQTYQARDIAGIRVVPVPKAAVRKFKKEFPKAHIDSCYVYGDDANPESEFMFYAKHESNSLKASYDKRGRPIESMVEVLIQALPEPLQQVLINNDLRTEGVSKAYRLVTWLPKRKKTKRRKKLPRRAKVEYMVELPNNSGGKKLMVPMYFNQDGSQANPGFR